MLKTTALRQVIVAMVIAVAAATVHGAWFAPTAANTSAPAVASIRLSTWDEFERKWTSYYIDQHLVLNPSVRHAEGALVELRPQAEGSAVDSIPGFIQELTSEQVEALGISLPLAVPSTVDAEYQVPAAGTPTYGRLKVSVPSTISESRPVGHVGTWAGPVNPIEGDINALDINGSVGVHPVNLTTGTDAVSFDWDIGRWAKGDVMMALNNATYRVVDRHGEFKRFVVSADYDRMSLGLYPTSAATTGCAANWRTGEFAVTNFSRFEPAVNVISRHPGTLSPAPNARPYAPIGRRLSTLIQRGNESINDWYHGIDNNPESVAFDAAGNLYVGHSAPNWDWETPAPAAWTNFVRPDPGPNFDQYLYWVWSIDDRPFEWNEGGTGYMVDETGTVLMLRTINSADGFVAAAYGYASRRLFHDSNGQLVFPATPTNYEAVPEGPLSLPLAYYAHRATGEWMEKQSAPGVQVPVRWPLGKRLHRYNVQADGSYRDSAHATPDRDLYWTFTGRQGTDWVDLAYSPYVENQTSEIIAFYTSEDAYIHRYSITNDWQLPDFGGGRLFPRGEFQDRRFHALRVLPPGDGTGGVIVAAGDAIFRFNQYGQYVQQYQIQDDPDILNASNGQNGLIQSFYTLEVDPTGRQLWASALQTGWVYVFDISSGRVLNRIQGVNFQAQDQLSLNLPEGRRVQGICIMWEYTAQQEICGDGVDNDGDGFIDENCKPLEVCSAQSPGDDDGDGFANNNDPDCGEDLAPIARDDRFVTTQNEQIVVFAGAPDGVLVNDYDPDNETTNALLHNQVTVLQVGTSGTPNLTAGALVTTSSGGTVTLQAQGGMIYDPPADFHGIDTFVYHVTDYTYMDGVTPPADINVSNVATVTIEVRPLVADDAYAMPERTTLDVDAASVNPVGLLLNDPSASLLIGAAGPSGVTSLGGNESVTFVTAEGGTVTVYATGRFTYTPLSTFVGTDSFNYRGVGLHGLTSVNTATVRIVVEDVNEVIATNDTYSTTFETPITGTLTTNDSDPEGHSFRITHINGQPVTVGDTVNVTNGTVTLDDLAGNVTITPAANFWGTLTFPYTIEDAPGPTSGMTPVTATATVTVVVIAPKVRTTNDYYVTVQNTTLVTASLPQAQSILSNDTGVTTVYSLGSFSGTAGSDLVLNGSPGVWTTLKGGTVTVSPDGTFVYVPPTNFVGVDSFIYNVWDPATNRVRADVFITVTPISSTLAVTTPDPSVYGTAATATATVTCGADQAPSVGTVTFRLDGAVIATGVPVINGVATTTLPATLVVGNHTIVAEYAGSAVEPTVCPSSSASDGHQVVRKLLVVTADDKTTTYDGTVFEGPYTVSYAGFAPGEDETDLGGALTFSGAATTAVNVGTYTGGIVPTGYTSTNYTIEYVAGTLTIDPLLLVVTADDKSKNYDGAVFGEPYTVSYAGFAPGDDQTDLGGALTFSGPATTAVNVGTYAAGILPAGYTSTNYTIAYVAGTLTIDPARLTVTADDKDKPYDGLVFSGPYTVTYSGFVGGDDVSALDGALTFSGAATTAVNVGTYSAGIVPAGYTSSNYTIEYVAGTLGIDPMLLVVTADDKSKSYDGAVYSPFTVTYSGFVGGDDASDLGGALTFSGTATTAVNVGTYTNGIVPAGYTSSNYTIQYVAGTLAIDPVLLVVTADDKSKSYDGAVYSPFTVTYSGFVGGDDASDLGGALTFSGPATTTVNVGTYADGIVPTGYTSSNYTIRYEPGTLTITPMPLVVKAADRSMPYNGSVYSSFTAAYSGFVGGDDVNALGGALTFSGDATTAVNVGTYTDGIVPAGYTSTNYTITYEPGTLTIAPIPATLKANDKSMVEGEPVPTLDGAWTGLLVGDVAGATYTTTGTSASPAGTYPIVPTPVDAQSVLANYTVTVISGTLTIRPASETVCYVSTRTANVGASQTWWTNVDGTMTIRTAVSRSFNDNTYGSNQVGWPGRNHSFNHLVTSDMVQVALYDATGARKLEMKLDYISASSQFISGYGSLGVSGGDGGMVFGSANHVMGADSSLAKNFNQFGYVLTSNSPATDANYTTNPTYPNWIWDMYYDVTINPEAFGAAGFGYPRITTMHASPSKSGIETEPLVVTECADVEVVSPPTSSEPPPPVVTPPGSGAAPTGAADSYTVRRGQTLTVNAANGVLANDASAVSRTAVVVGNVSRGTLTLNADGSFTYRAQSGWAGTVRFTYAVKVGSATSAPIPVAIAITR